MTHQPSFARAEFAAKKKVTRGEKFLARMEEATLIAVPSSRKKQARQRDPEMHQTKKGSRWHFGMKAHIGADRASKLLHTVVVTAANVVIGSRTTGVAAKNRSRTAGTAWDEVSVGRAVSDFCSARLKLPPANIENPKLGFIQRFPLPSRCGSQTRAPFPRPHPGTAPIPA